MPEFQKPYPVFPFFFPELSFIPLILMEISCTPNALMRPLNKQKCFRCDFPWEEVKTVYLARRQHCLIAHRQWQGNLDFKMMMILKYHASILVLRSFIIYGFSFLSKSFRWTWANKLTISLNICWTFAVSFSCDYFGAAFGIFSWKIETVATNNKHAHYAS